MTISLRLDSTLENKLNAYAQSTGRPKSELIRTLVSEFLEKEMRNQTPWELGEKVFGREGSGRGDLSINRKAILKEKLHARKSRH